MNRIEEIKERLNGYKAAQGYSNQRTPILVSHRRELMVGYEQNSVNDMEYLLSNLGLAEKALDEFTEKHFHGGSKANRDDYVSLGIPTSDIYKLREALKAIRE